MRRVIKESSAGSASSSLVSPVPQQSRFGEWAPPPPQPQMAVQIPPASVTRTPEAISPQVLEFYREKNLSSEVDGAFATNLKVDIVCPKKFSRFFHANQTLERCIELLNQKVKTITIFRCLVALSHGRSLPGQLLLLT